jgi:DNA-binding MarR family transcriptional regulator
VSVTEAGQGFVADKRRAGEEWLARSLQEGYTERERGIIIEAMALLDRLVRS